MSTPPAATPPPFPIEWRLTILTPTLVGDGKRLAPIDYMVWKDQVNVLDQSLIFRRLAGTPRMEGYLAELGRARRLEFKNWGGYAQSYAVRRIPLEDPGLVPLWEQAKDEEIFIPTFCTGPRGKLLPATALKGALKTALLAAQLPPEQLASFRNMSAAKLLRGWRLGDGAPEAGDSYRVYYARVATPAKSGGPELRWKPAPAFVECAAPGTVFRGRGTVTGDWAAEFAAVTAQSASLLARQREFAATHRLGRLAQTLAQVEAGGGCLLNLGWGGGFLSKSVAGGPRLAAARPLLDAIPAYRRALASSFPFPKSQRIFYLGGEPGTVPGWVRLEYYPIPAPQQS
jgi:CRISPR-associated protein Csm5